MHPRAQLLIVAALLLASLPASTRADVFTVDSTADAVDAVPGDSTCATAASACTLRAAVQEANAHPGPDDIALPAGAYVFTLLQQGEQQAASGDLDIRDALTITGAGADLTLIDGAALEFILTVWGVDLRLEGLTLANSGDSAIVATLGSGLRIDACTIRDNSGTDGAGLWADSPACVDVTRSRFERNIAVEDAGGAWIDDTRARFEDCVFLDNRSAGRGGGIHLAGDPTSFLLVRRCTFEGNEATWGGGLNVNSPNGSSPGPVSIIVESSFLVNRVSAAGGGLFTGGDLQVDRCHVEGNFATNGGGHAIVRGDARITCSEYVGNTADNGSNSGDGGGLDVDGGTFSLEDSLVLNNFAVSSGGGLNTSSLTTPLLLRCTIASNSADSQGGGLTGWDNVTIVDSTIRDNQSRAQGGGLNLIRAFRISGSTITGNETATSSGGGVYISSARDSSLVNTTISGNRGPNGSGVSIASAGTGTILMRNCTVTANISSGSLGGLRNAAGAGGLSLRDSVIAGNTGGSAPDCSGAITSEGHVLVGDPAGCGLVAQPTDLLGVDPLLGPLADNDGLTLTHAPQPGSPLLDGGDPAGCRDWDDGALATDQRGVDRPVDADGDGVPRCDIGALESTSADTSAAGLSGVPDCGVTRPLPPLPSCFDVADSDGDGVLDDADCAPNDPTATALPIEVTLRVEKAASAGDIRAWWSDATVNGDTGTHHEMARGSLAALFGGSGALGTCVTPTGRLEHVEPILPGENAWYLVRGVNACGPPAGVGWGRDSLGAERPGCP